ncbi:hypothetical protein [Streptomyces alfalfae]
MTYSNSDTALDALLGAADDAVLTRLDEAADLDAGRAAVFASFTADAAPSFEADAAEDTRGLCDPALEAGDFLIQAVEKAEQNYQVIEIVKKLEDLAWQLSRLREWLRKNGFDTQVQVRLYSPQRDLHRLAQSLSDRELKLQDALFMITRVARAMKRLRMEVVVECERLDLDGSQFHRRAANFYAELSRVRSLMVRLFAGDDHDSRVPTPIR